MFFSFLLLTYPYFHLFLYSSDTLKLPADRFISQDKKSGGGGGAGESSGSDTKKFILSSAEELYAELRDKNFHAVGQTLKKKAKSISAQYDVSTATKYLYTEYLTHFVHLNKARRSTLYFTIPFGTISLCLEY